jgi:hypothetical protein
MNSANANLKFLPDNSRHAAMGVALLSILTLLPVTQGMQAVVPQDASTTQLLLPAVNLLSRFVIDGKCTDSDELAGTVLELQGNQGHPFRIEIETQVPICLFTEVSGLDIEAEPLAWNFENAWPLSVTILPAIVDGSVQWTVADFSLQDGAGDVVDDPPGIIGILIGLLQDACRNAFIGELIEVARATYPDGLPGIPRFENVYIDHAHDNIIVDIVFEDAFKRLEGLVGTGRVVSQGDASLQHTITEAQLDAAFLILGGQGRDWLFLDWELGEAMVSVYLARLGAQGVTVLKITYTPAQGFLGTDTFTYAFFGTDSDSTEPLYTVNEVTMEHLQTDETDPQQLAQDIGPLGFRTLAPSTLPNAPLLQWTSRTLNRFLRMQIGFAAVQDFGVREGAIDISVVPR